MFLKISQNSQVNTYARASFLNKVAGLTHFSRTPPASVILRLISNIRSTRDKDIGGICQSNFQ